MNKLGPFQYEEPKDDGVKREFRPVSVQENNARYEGEWNVELNTRDGKGCQIWPDGSRYEGYWAHDKANGQG